MIECRIRQAAEKRGISNKYQLAQAIARVNGREVGARDLMLAGRVWKDGAQPTLDSVSKVIAALRGATVAELLVYKADSPLPAKKNGHKRKSATKR